MVKFKNSGKFERLIFPNGSTTKVSSSKKELVLILLQGHMIVKNSNLFLKRESVFGDEPKGFVVANQGDIELSTQGHAQACLVSIDSDKSIPLKEIGKPKSTWTGTGNSYRKVSRLADADDDLDNLIVGETISPAGNWSSWPPHKHDTYEKNLESAQEEVYFYKFENEKGFGVQLVDDNAHVVRDGDSVKIERGTHPVACSPYSRMHYFWCLYGDNSFFKRRFED